MIEEKLIMIKEQLRILSLMRLTNKFGLYSYNPHEDELRKDIINDISRLNEDVVQILSGLDEETKSRIFKWSREHLFLDIEWLRSEYGNSNG